MVPQSQRRHFERRLIMTLQSRLLLVLLSLLAVVLAVFCTVVYLLVRQNLQTDIDQFVLDKALLLGHAVNPVNPAWIRFEERAWRSPRFTPVGQTFDTNWQPVFVSQRLPAPILPSEQVKREAAHPSGIVHHDAVAPDGRRYRMATVTVNREGKFLCYAQIGVPLEGRDRPLRLLVGWLVSGSLITWIGAWVAAGYLVQQWRAPLAMLGETARRVRVQNLARQRLFAPSDVPELAQVAQAFNELLDQLDTAHKAQQRFVADASHELRTPLAIVRGEIEVALRRDRAALEYREILQSCREEIERLSRLTENLLALARADVGEARDRRERVDMGTVCREVCEQLGPLAAAKGVSLEVNASQTSETTGDRVALGQVVFNLVENAVRYTPAGERVTVATLSQGDEVQVTVADTGPGIPAEHLPHLFERFYRVDKARTRELGGAGLGLAIVRTLTEFHGGRVEVQSVLGQGTTFTVRLPRWPSASA